jgi:hypothetical protein
MEGSVTRPLQRFSPPVSLVVCWLALSSFPATAQQVQTNPSVIFEGYHDTSPPLRDLARTVSSQEAAGLPREVRDLGERHKPASVKPQVDPVVQSSAGPAVGTIAGVNFDGIGKGDYGFQGIYTPPDTNGVAGATQFVHVVNASYAVFDKTNGNLLLGPFNLRTLWQGFGGPCATKDIVDPIAQYDKAAKRWLIGGIGNWLNGPPVYECLAVSQTSDATGAYNRYAISFIASQSTRPFDDKLAVWPDAYYLGYDFRDGSAQVCALDRGKMLAGLPMTAVCFVGPGNQDNLLPADLDGSVSPPTGAPNYFIGGLNNAPNTLNLFKFHVDFANPANSTFTGPFVITVASYTQACAGFGGFNDCIPQKGTHQLIESLSDRLMYRNAYRNFRSNSAQVGHETLVVNHSVNAGSSVGVRWYELRALENGKFTLFQQGTYAPDANFRWMGSIAMDKVGDIALGYSLSSGTINPSISYTGRVPTDPPGIMEGENSIIAGGGFQSYDRWGDYSGMSVDPVDDCTFWFTTEYLKTNGGQASWSTRIASFKFPGCR